ncbi:hypothetical protein DH2020_022280 [Rehmannia glutinosa]|uniref:F-box domain-containing protein n=1 Tax=Rehmannia glutinosa TaxID=99300 RepID=A0ABR0WE81_REHGL
MKGSISNCSSFESIPNELISEVLSRVAASSLTDMFNAKLSCKILNEIAEEKQVYQRVSLDKFPIVPWKPLNEKQQVFLNKCQQSENPDFMYRQAVLDYFNKTDLRSACQHLEKAVKLGHIGSQYLTCIILILCGDDELIKAGIKILCDFRKSKFTKRILKFCRKKLIKILRQMWVKNYLLIQPPTFCSTPNQHQWKSQWSEDDENIKCEACIADREIRIISSTYNYYL